MTYQEIKSRLEKCEYSLKTIQDAKYSKSNHNISDKIQKLQILKESLKTRLKEAEKGVIYTDDEKKAKDLADDGSNVQLTKEGPYQTTYVKVAQRDYKKAMAILDRAIDPTYTKMDIVDDDGDGNVIIYFNFRAKDDGEPDEDQGEFIYDLSMDLQSRGVQVVAASHDIDEARDINDPVLMKLRALKTKIGRKKGIVKGGERHTGKKTALISKLQTKRDQVMRDMEQEAEPEGGPIADKYGDILNKIDTAIAKAKGTKSKSYGDTFNEGWDNQDDVFAFGYNLDLIQAVVDHLKSNYSEDDFELHVGRGDTHPNAVTLKNPNMDNDKELGNLLIAAEDQEETDYEINRRGDYMEEEVTELTKQDLSNIAHQAGKAIVKAIRQSGDEVDKAKIKDIYNSALSNNSPESFTVHIIYKNDSEVSYRFHIHNKVLYFLDGNQDVKISGVGIKPSGEPVINSELIKREMLKYFKQMQEMTDKEFSAAQEADRLADHPERDKIIAIQNLIAKEKGVKEEDIDVGHQDDEPSMLKSSAMETAQYAAKLYKKLDKYDKFHGEVDFPNWWQKKLILARDYMSAAFHYLDSGEKQPNIDQLALEGSIKEGYTKQKLLAYLGQADDAMIRTYDDKYLIIYNPKSGNDDNANMWGDETVFAVDQDGQEHEVRYDNIDGLQLEENLKLDKITKAKRLIKQQAPAMNKLPQDDPKRKAFIDKVKQVNKKHKELLAKQDDKVPGIGKDQELSEGRGDFDDVLKAIENMSNNDDISERDAAAEIVLALADRFQLPVDKNLEDYMEESVSEVKVGDTLSKDGKKGKVIKISDTQATVDFGNGDVYGIAHSRIKGQEILKENSMELETLFGALGYSGGFEEFIEDNPGAVEALHGWITSVPEFRKRLSAEFSNSELDGMGIYDIPGYDDDDENMDEAGPGYKHDCAAKVVHEKYGKGKCIPEKHTLVKEGEKHVVTHYDVLFESGKTVKDIPVTELEIKTSNEHWHKGYKKKKK